MARIMSKLRRAERLQEVLMLRDYMTLVAEELSE